MIFRQIESGGDRNYSYIIACENTRKCAIVDPSPEPEIVAEAVNNLDLEVGYIINTHSHYDHSSGNDYFIRNARSSPPVLINCGKNLIKDDNFIQQIGEVRLEFIFTPGHTPDSICIKAGEKLITGDTLFVGKVGGTYGINDAKKEFESLKKICLLPAETEVWPGHNYGVSPSSTIGHEMENNPFITRLSNFDDFLWLKENWAEYKHKHGIK